MNNLFSGKGIAHGYFNWQVNFSSDSFHTREWQAKRSKSRVSPSHPGFWSCSRQHSTLPTCSRQHPTLPTWTVPPVVMVPGSLVEQGAIMHLKYAATNVREDQFQVRETTEHLMKESCSLSSSKKVDSTVFVATLSC